MDTQFPSPPTIESSPAPSLAPVAVQTSSGNGSFTDSGGTNG
jgi:hypothetical protein